MGERLIVFTRYPEPGATKTRLIPALGAEGAAALQRQMTEHTLATAAELARRRPVAIEVRYAGGDDRRMREWLGERWPIRPQGEGDLGARMRRAFREAFAAGNEAVIIIGVDCPDITADVLRCAFDHLAQCEAVFGPANDGGYYLIGLRRDLPQIFEGIRWGSDEVFAATMVIAARIGLTAALLRPLDDVDRPEDLPVWDAARQKASRALSADRISIIIPALNEARILRQTLNAARRGDDIEIIVVDGGSGDGTPDVARALGCKVLAGPRCRAAQMNLGASDATGGIILFLHADTLLPDHYDDHVLRLLAEPGVVAGAFELRIDSPRRSLRLIERGANWRSRRLGMPWGDQTLFLKREIFRELGGFPEIPLMEDYEMSRRLRRRGKIAIAPVAVVTSGRRWQRLGVWRAWLVNRAIVLGYRLGVPAAVLARLYRQKTSTKGQENP